MIWGYDSFTNSMFTTPLSSTNINRLELRNAKYDEIKMDAYADMTKPITTAKEEWGVYTILLGKFMNDLEAGNVENKGLPIEYLRFKRKKVGDLKWQTLKDFVYNENVKLYDLDDYFIENTKNYIYGISPVCESVEGKTNESDIIQSNFDASFIIDSDNNIRLYYDINLDDIDHQETTSIIETLGSKFPIVISSEADYLKGGLTVTLATDSTIDGSAIDLKSEIENRENIVKIFKNKKAKLIKTHSGLFAIVRLMNVKEKPNNNLSGELFQISFEFVELADSSDMTQFKANGLLYK